MSNYDKCFEKHSFAELNDMDIGKFYNIMNTYGNKLNKEISIFFDVGCNAGSFVKVLQQYGFHNNIHCFEPHPVLSKVVKNIYPYIEMNEFCLSNYNGSATIHIPTWSVGLSSLIRRPVFDRLGQDINELSVPCLTLDYYCYQNNIDHIDFLKIDVEGAEKLVFQGAHQLLSNHKVYSGLFEIGDTLEDAGTSTEELCRMIEGYGYKLDKGFSESDIYFYL